MTIELNHTIVRAHDKHASAAFLARVLDLPVGAPWGPFVPVTIGRVTLDYLDDRSDFTPQHYAFLVGDKEFDAALARLGEDAVRIWADPDRHEPDTINHRYGGRGVYFQDPDGHLMELLTAPYTDPG